MAQRAGLTLASSEPQPLHLQIRGLNGCAAPPTAPREGQGGPPGSRPLPALWPPQGRSEMSRGVPVSRGGQRGGTWARHFTGSRLLHLASPPWRACSASGQQAWALASIPCWPPPLHNQLPGSGPGRLAPLAGLVGQLASAPLGAKRGRSCPAGCPGMQGSPGLLLRLCGLRCVFLTGPRGPSCLDLPSVLVWSCL